MKMGKFIDGEWKILNIPKKILKQMNAHWMAA